ncbi:MAG: hypothetical protein RQ966_04420 [Acetobacteraceae bacterium]|nr:hypothetical protein [Acetobacteraceae bacterium]
MLPPDLDVVHPLLPPAVTVHSLVQARKALAPGRAVTLLSARGAAVFAGAAWWRGLIEACGTEEPDVLDCADAPGRALEALALGCRRVILDPCPAWPAVAERAALAGALLLEARPASLDLADPAAARRIAAWLGVG